MNHPMPLSGRPLAFLGCIVASLALSACAGKSDGDARPDMIQPITNAQQIDDVVALLAEGQTKVASKRLKQMLKREPGDQRAARLLESIDADPIALLGAKNFQYRVQPGDRMEELANRYLGDALKFYALSRYNGISVPSSLQVGQIIRVPGERPPASEQRKPQPASPRSDRTPAAQTKSSPAKPPAVDAHQVNRLRSAGLTALNQGDVERAVGLLRQAAALQPGDDRIQADLARAERIQRTVRSRK